MNIQEGLDRFLTQLRADGRSSHTVRQYRRHVTLFAQWVNKTGLRELPEISSDTVAEFFCTPEVTAPGGTPKLQTSLNALRASIRGFFRYCHRAGLVPEDPTRLLRNAKTQAPPPEALSPAELDKLFDAFATHEGPEARRDEMLFRLMLKTGLRLSSALALVTADVRLARREIHLRSLKGDRRDRVYLGTEITRGLRDYLMKLPMGPLFRARSGRAMSHRHAQRLLGMWLDKAGVSTRYSPHSLRHSFAMRLYEKTGDIRLVQTALHHRSIATTMVYARTSEDQLRSALG